MRRHCFLTICTMLMCIPAIIAQDKPLLASSIKQEESIISTMKTWKNRPWLQGNLALVALPSKDYSSMAEFSPDCKKLAAFAEEFFRIYDLATGKLHLEIKVSRPKFGSLVINEVFRWSPNGEYLAMPSGDKLAVRSSNTGELVKEFAFDGLLNSVRFTPDGKRLTAVILNFKDNKRIIRQWNTADWTVITPEFVLDRPYSPYTLSNDGAKLIYQLENVFNKLPHPDIVLHDLMTGKQISVKVDASWKSFDVSRDYSKALVTRYLEDRRETVLSLLDLTTGKHRELFAFTGAAPQPRLTPDAKYFYFSEQSDAIAGSITRFLDIETSKDAFSLLRLRESEVIFSPAGLLMATAALGFDYRPHLFEVPALINTKRLEDSDAIRKVRKAGIAVMYQPNQIHFEHSTTDFNFKEKFLAAHDAYPKAASVKLARPIGNGQGNYKDFFSNLQKFKDLEALNSTGAFINDDCLSEISKLTNLKYLEIESGFDITSTGLNKLNTLTKLETLILRNCREIKSGAWDALAKLPSLTFLEIRYDSNVDSVNIEKISSLTKLKTLKLTGNKTLTGEIFKHIGSLKQLETLELEKFTFSNDDLSQLLKLQSLSTLTLGYESSPPTNAAFSDAGVEKLKELRNLRSLSILSGNQLHLRALQGLDWSKIQHLNIQGLELLGKDLDTLKDAKELRYLGLPNFSGNGVYEFAGLKSLPKLETLKLTYGMYQSGSVTELRKLLPQVYLTPVTD